MTNYKRELINLYSLSLLIDSDGPSRWHDSQRIIVDEQLDSDLASEVL